MKSSIDSKQIVVVMAGGQGSRFWPVSRAKRPKQFLSISDSGESLIQATVRRVSELVEPGNIWVVSNPSLQELIESQVSEAIFLPEPIARNTAACIGLAAVHALLDLKENEEAVLIILPADHAITDEEKLRAALSSGLQVAASDNLLVTIGIPPTHPHTGYGYIKRGQKISEGVSKVERFYEKPSFERAQKYLESEDYFWNSGMFIWRASVILKAFSEFLPEMHAGLREIQEILQSYPKQERSSQAVTELIAPIFNQLESVSIDFGILEHARNCIVIEAEEFGWNDVGSWDQWAENFESDHDGNLIKGDAVVIDSTSCVVHGTDRLVALVGVKDIVLVDTGDALLVVARDSVQDVRKIVEELRRRGRNDLL